MLFVGGGGGGFVYWAVAVMDNMFTPIPWASRKVPGDEEGGSCAKSWSPSEWFGMAASSR